MSASVLDCHDNTSVTSRSTNGTHNGLTTGSPCWRVREVQRQMTLRWRQDSGSSQGSDVEGGNSTTAHRDMFGTTTFQSIHGWEHPNEKRTEPTFAITQHKCTANISRVVVDDELMEENR